MKRLVFAIVVLVAAAAVNAQELSWACAYSDKGVQAEFDKKGTPTVSSGAAGMDPFVLVLDSDAGKAGLRANITVEVFPIFSGGTLNFIEETPSGISVITLFVSSPLDKLERVPFAQARHLDLAGPFPQQYYGICTPSNN